MFSIYFLPASYSPSATPLLAPIAAHMYEYFNISGKIVFPYYKLLEHVSFYYSAIYFMCIKQEAWA